MKKIPPRAFSLVEVVLALSITAFCLVALMGLFTAGLKTEKESADALKVSHIAQSIIAKRRGAPTAALGNEFPLPVLQRGSSASSTVSLTEDGTVPKQGERAVYNLAYRIDAPAVGSPKNFVIYLDFYWPAQATPKNAAGHYELATSVSIP